MDGTSSYDSDGDALEYYWFVDSNEIATGAEPNILLPVGEHEVTLFVNDGAVDSEPNSCMITVLPTVETQISTRPEVVSMSKLPLDMFVKMKLPEGVEPFDIATPMTLEPWGIEVFGQFLVAHGKNNLVYAYFTLDTGLEFTPSPMTVTAVGQLQSGEYIYGTDTINCINRILL